MNPKTTSQFEKVLSEKNKLLMEARLGVRLGSYKRLEGAALRKHWKSAALLEKKLARYHQVHDDPERATVSLISAASCFVFAGLFETARAHYQQAVALGFKDEKQSLLDWINKKSRTEAPRG